MIRGTDFIWRFYRILWNKSQKYAVINIYTQYDLVIQPPSNNIRLIMM